MTNTLKRNLKYCIILLYFFIRFINLAIYVLDAVFPSLHIIVLFYTAEIAIFLTFHLTFNKNVLCIQNCTFLYWISLSCCMVFLGRYCTLLVPVLNVSYCRIFCCIISIAFLLFCHPPAGSPVVLSLFKCPFSPSPVAIFRPVQLSSHILLKCHLASFSAD